MNQYIKAFALPFYGFWIAAIYFAYRQFFHHVLIESFSIGALIGATFLFLFFYREFFCVFRQPLAWARAISFALTQVFIFRALIDGETTTVFASSSASLLITLPLASLVTRERVVPLEAIGVFGAVVGLAIMGASSNSTFNGVAAGCFQALSVVISRRVGRSDSPVVGNVILGLFLAGGISSVLSYTNPFLLLTNPEVAFGSALMTVSTQVYVLWLGFRWPSITVNQVSQSRIVWAVFLEALVAKQLPTCQTLIGSLLVFVSALLTISLHLKQSKLFGKSG